MVSLCQKYLHLNFFFLIWFPCKWLIEPGILIFLLVLLFSLPYEGYLPEKRVIQMVETVLIINGSASAENTVTEAHEQVAAAGACSLGVCKALHSSVVQELKVSLQNSTEISIILFSFCQCSIRLTQKNIS